MEFSPPTDINFFTTYRCNSRCLNCRIWRNSGSTKEPAIDMELIHKLIGDPFFQECGNIGFAGGEPTIASFFWKFMEQVPADKHVAITTNALSSGNLVEFLSHVRNPSNFMVQVSLDGIGTINDQIRGISGAYEKTIKLLECLRDMGVGRLVSFTINRLNHHQLLDSYALADSYGARFSTRMAYAGGAYRNKESLDLFQFQEFELETLEQELKEIIHREFAKPEHSPAKLVFWDKIIAYYKGRQRDLPCQSMQSGLVIDLFGQVFPNCPVMMKPIGDCRKNTLTEIWHGQKAADIRENIAAFKCGGCWNDCQVITNIESLPDFLEAEYESLKMNYLTKANIPNMTNLDGITSPLLLSGWYDLEDVRFGCRWTRQHFSIALPAGSSAVEITFMAPASKKDTGSDIPLEVYLENTLLNTIPLKTAEWKKHRIDLPHKIGELTPLHFRLNRYFCPKEENVGSDHRKLGAAVSNLVFPKN